MLSKQTQLFFLLSLLIVLFCGVANAAPPFQTSDSTSGFDIAYAKVENVKQYENIVLDFHVLNSSNGIPINSSQASCLLHFYTINGTQLDFSNAVTIRTPNEWEYVIPGNNFTNLGQYSFIFQCNNSIGGGYASGPINVTTTGDSRDYGIFLILGFFGILIFIFGYYEHNIWFVYISGILFLVLGVYVLIYGYGGIRDTFTDPIGYVSLGLGIFFFVIGGYEQLSGDDDDEDEGDN